MKIKNTHNKYVKVVQYHKNAYLATLISWLFNALQCAHKIFCLHVSQISLTWSLPLIMVPMVALTSSWGPLYTYPACLKKCPSQTLQDQSQLLVMTWAAPVKTRSAIKYFQILINLFTCLLGNVYSEHL